MSIWKAKVTTKYATLECPVIWVGMCVCVSYLIIIPSFSKVKLYALRVRMSK